MSLPVRSGGKVGGGTLLLRRRLLLCSLATAYMQPYAPHSAALFGAAASPTPPPPGYVPPILELRHKFNLYANVRPMVSAQVDTKAARNNVDMVVIREVSRSSPTFLLRW